MKKYLKESEKEELCGREEVRCDGAHTETRGIAQGYLGGGGRKEKMKGKTQLRILRPNMGCETFRASCMSVCKVFVKLTNRHTTGPQRGERAWGRAEWRQVVVSIQSQDCVLDDDDDNEYKG